MAKKYTKIIAIICAMFTILLCMTGCKKDSVGSAREYRFENKSYIILTDDYQNGVYEKTYTGEYDKQSIKSDTDISYKDIVDYCEIVSYEKYVAFCKTWGATQTYKDKTLNYIIVAMATGKPDKAHLRLHDIHFTQNQAKIIYRKEVEYSNIVTVAPIYGYEAEFIFIPVIKDVVELVETQIVYESEFENLERSWQSVN